ncbi:hypothetical protein NMK97_04180 [Bacillus amyloliquefaciens]|nr:hypothetical protein NMK97_04180 [Bacillus amyloliquefaciens]
MFSDLLQCHPAFFLLSHTSHSSLGFLFVTSIISVLTAEKKERGEKMTKRRKTDCPSALLSQ